MTLDALHQKVDAISGQVADIRVMSGRIEADLLHHIKRTDLLETRVEQFSAVVDRAKGVGTAVSALGWMLATAATLLEMWRAMRGH
jgi:hypothetical protein